MNIKEIERMWKKASRCEDHDTNWYDPTVVKFAELLAAAEREKFCAQLRQLHDSYSLQSDSSSLRARGQQ